jgi:hypothetical protein
MMIVVLAGVAFLVDLPLSFGGDQAQSIIP